MSRPMPDSDSPVTSCWRVSSGSAAVLGLHPMIMDVAPTTAYLMLGGRCSRDCAFCAQARQSAAQAGALSRVIWPEYGIRDIVAGVANAHGDGRIARACFQVTASPGYLAATLNAVSTLAAHSEVPICASVTPASLDDVAAVFEAGAQRISLALDAACERIHRLTKGGNWSRTLALLESAAVRFPGRVGTHLIVGLGETDADAGAAHPATHR